MIVGYFDQHFAGVSTTTRWSMRSAPRHKDFVAQQRRDLLARFGITGDTALQKVGSLSGGERAAQLWPGWRPRMPTSSCSTNRRTIWICGPATPWSRH